MTSVRQMMSGFDAAAGQSRKRPLPRLPNLDVADPPREPLTDRELTCLRWVSLGKTAWETATIIGRSRRTVEFHLLNAMRKLGAVNKVHAAVIAVRQGLI